MSLISPEYSKEGEGESCQVDHRLLEPVAQVPQPLPELVLLEAQHLLVSGLPGAWPGTETSKVSKLCLLSSSSQPSRVSILSS